MSSRVSQSAFLTYMHYIDDVKVIESCCRKQQLDRISFEEGRFVKLPSSSHTAYSSHARNFFHNGHRRLLHAQRMSLRGFTGRRVCRFVKSSNGQESRRTCPNKIEAEEISSKSGLEKFSKLELQEIESRISFINTIHGHVEEGNLEKITDTDCSPLVADYYKTHLKLIKAWNQLFVRATLHIKILNHPSIVDFSPISDLDDKALVEYFERLEMHPAQLKRDGKNNDSKQGALEIRYDLETIRSIQNEKYHKMYEDFIKKDFSPSQAREKAAAESRPGVVGQDKYLLWIRDAVISPRGERLLYNRMVPPASLRNKFGIGGVAALPIVSYPNELEKKIILILTFRHATSSWEFEIPRGFTKPDEDPITAASREVREEIGDNLLDLQPLGEIAENSGLTSAIVPIFIGQVKVESAQTTKFSKGEAIQGKYAFSLKEIEEGYKQGYIEVEIEGKKFRGAVRDPYLAYALLSAHLRDIFVLGQRSDLVVLNKSS